MYLNASTLAHRVQYEPRRRHYLDHRHHRITRDCTLRRWFGAVSPGISAVAAPVSKHVGPHDLLIGVHYHAGDAAVAPRFGALDTRFKVRPVEAAVVVNRVAGWLEATLPRPGRVRVFITADDSRFISALSAHLAPQRRLLHLIHNFSRLENESVRADMHAIAEWHLLARSTVFLMLSHSAFATSVAQLRMWQCSVPHSRRRCMEPEDWSSGPPHPLLASEVHPHFQHKKSHSAVSCD